MASDEKHDSKAKKKSTVQSSTEKVDSAGLNDEVQELENAHEESTANLAISLSDDEVKDLFEKIYKSAHTSPGTDESLQSLLQKLNTQQLAFLEANSELVDRVMLADNEGELSEILSNLKVKTHTNIADTEAVKLTNDQVNYLKKQWAWVVLSAEENKSSDLEASQKIFDAFGLPVLYRPASDGRPATIGFSTLGNKGYDISLVTKGDIDADFLAEGEAPGASSPSGEEIMHTCFSLIQLAQKQGFGQFKIDGGHQDLKRNVWALATVHGIKHTGYTPSVDDHAWLKAREKHLLEAFSLQNQKVSHPSIHLGGSHQDANDGQDGS
ncbi:MAG: hypothetical protein VX112_03570 [Pseudomonadota bacterium]|nr:hypothetical protein [Pseudomonadota bacterium]